MAAAPPALATAPRARLGIVGGGQLGRMLALAAHSLGIASTCLDAGGARSPAGQVTAAVEGALSDAAALRALAARSDVLTVEIEHVDVDALEAAAAAAGIPVHPAPATLRLIQDKLAQKRFFAERGVALGDFVGVASEAELAGAIEVRLLRARARARAAPAGGAPAAPRSRHAP
jgi:phosphoribosylaminoimidazole carboxylase (NCAIR synthetase)